MSSYYDFGLGLYVILVTFNRRICYQVVTGIVLPSGIDKLYTGSQDETVRVWDCQSGQVVYMFTFSLAYFCFSLILTAFY